MTTYLRQERRQSLEEEVFYSGGHSIDCDVKTLDVEERIFVKLLEDQVDMRSVTRHPVETLCSNTLRLYELNTPTQEYGDRVFITSSENILICKIIFKAENFAT